MGLAVTTKTFENGYFLSGRLRALVVVGSGLCAGAAAIKWMECPHTILSSGTLGNVQCDVWALVVQ